MSPFIQTSLADRTTSSIPVAIGTSLALESIFKGPLPYYDPNRVIPDQIDLRKYDEIWFNLTTLIRNITAAVPKEVTAKLKARDLADVLLSEIDTINTIFEIEGRNLCRPSYYYCTYQSLMRRYKDGRVKFRVEKTPGQKLYKQLVDTALDLIFKQTDAFHKFDSELKTRLNTNSLIFTHQPYDLLSRTRFQRLDLLESHTGKLKPPHLWYTKYYPVGDEDLSMLPFNERLLLIFGDKILISPNDIRLRELIVTTAKQHRWTSTISDVRILADLKADIKEVFVYKFVEEIV